MVAPSASWEGSFCTAPPDRDFLSNIIQRLRLPGSMPMLVLYAHGTEHSNLVAIVRLANVARLEGIESANEGEQNKRKLSLPC